MISHYFVFVKNYLKAMGNIVLFLVKILKIIVCQFMCVK
jgi:hypothetical protein